MENKRFFEIEGIYGRKIIKRRRFYLVKWKGYNHNENTWEPTRNLTNARKLIRNYINSVKTPQNQKKKRKSIKKPIKQEEIQGKFSFAMAKKIKSHIFLRDSKEKLLKDQIFFEIEWENEIKPTKEPSKLIIPSLEPIKSVKEHCPLLLCEYYEKFIDFK